MESSSRDHDLPVIAMRDLAVPSLRNPAAIAIRDVQWSVAPGDFWVVAGLHGSGKSDFLMLTAGLTGPSRGTYQLFGETMPIFDDARLRHRLRLGLAFENGQLFNHLSVFENVVLPLRYHHDLKKSEAEDQGRQLLDALELSPWANATPGAIGRNWQKRVGLARALALKPELLLLDDPLSGLDLRHERWWLAFLRHLSHGHPLLDGRKLTLVATAADLRPWKSLARQFALLSETNFSVLGTWSEIESATSDLVHELLMTESGA